MNWPSDIRAAINSLFGRSARSWRRDRRRIESWLVLSLPEAVPTTTARPTVCMMLSCVTCLVHVAITTSSFPPGSTNAWSTKADHAPAISTCVIADLEFVVRHATHSRVPASSLDVLGHDARCRLEPRGWVDAECGVIGRASSTGCVYSGAGGDCGYRRSGHS